MVYFEISRIGFNCGLEKSQCSKYPHDCTNCIKKNLGGLGLDSDLIRIYEMDTEDKRMKMLRERIWHKFLDVLNLRHIVIMDKNSGIPIINYAISGAQLDAGILSGFIQANIIFSKGGVAEKDSEMHKEQQFYEFQYESFNILLKNGEYIRICLILDQKASDNLRNTLLEFQNNFEFKYQNKLELLKSTGKLDLDETFDYIIDIFNVQLLFPMTLTHTITPDLIQQIGKNNIQKSVVKFAKEMLLSKPFFFVNNLIDKVKNIVNMEANIILYEIYQLLNLNIIIPTTLEETQTKFKTFQENKAEKMAKMESISSIITGNDDLIKLQEQIKTIDQSTAKKMMENFKKKAEAAEKGLMYNEAQKEYEKALYLARGFGFSEEIGSISFLVFELAKKNKQLELDYELEAGEKAEKKKDYISGLKHYKKAIGIIENFFKSSEYDVKMKKLNKKIEKMESRI